MARVDERMVELHHKYDGQTFMNTTLHVWQPVLAMFVGVYLLIVAPQWTQTWWLGILTWTWAIFREVDLSHHLSHNAVFDDPKKNRWYNEYHMMLVLLASMVAWHSASILSTMPVQIYLGMIPPCICPSNGERMPQLDCNPRQHFQEVLLFSSVVCFSLLGIQQSIHRVVFVFGAKFEPIV